MTADTGIPGLGGGPVDLEAAPSIAQRVAALNAVRSVNEAMGKYNPATLAALHWGERAVQEIARLSAEVERLRPVVEAAQVWQRMRAGTPTTPKPESAALLAAVEAFEAAGGEVR